MTSFAAFHHVQIAMPRGREIEAEAFYSDVLGFDRIPKPTHLEARGGAWFRSGSVELHIGVEDDFRPSRKAHPALLVEGLADLRERLSSAGVAIEEDTQLEGHDRFYVSDPFGNRLELIERAPTP